jgi:formylglycine-generating enzyme required for sulfatase activity
MARSAHPGVTKKEMSGGRWESDPEDGRIANRMYMPASYSDYHLGFRLIRPVQW